MDWVDKPNNYKDLYRILQLLRGSRLNNFPLKTLKLGWVAFHSEGCPIHTDSNGIVLNALVFHW